MRIPEGFIPIRTAIESNASISAMEKWLKAIFEGREQIPNTTLFGNTSVVGIIVQVQEYLDDEVQRYLVEAVRYMFRAWTRYPAGVQTSVAIGLIQIATELRLSDLISQFEGLSEREDIDQQIKNEINEALKRL